jgi:acetoin utilization protein AcuB
LSSQNIERFMSRVLVVVDPRQSLGEASQLMRGHGIRHLPVVQAGEVVGILSQRDVYLVETLSNASPREISVEEAMTREPFHVDPEEPLHSVARSMAARRIGSVVVSRDGKLLGLFTVTDALQALAVYAHAQPPDALLPLADDAVEA